MLGISLLKKINYQTPRNLYFWEDQLILGLIEYRSTQIKIYLSQNFIEVSLSHFDILSATYCAPVSLIEVFPLLK